MKTYIVEYTVHQYDFYPQEINITIFKTKDESYAKNYVKKFNTVLEKAKKHIEYMRRSRLASAYLSKWHIKIKHISECYYMDCICQRTETRP